MTEKLNKKDVVYYARIIPKLGIYDVCEIIIRTVEDTWFAGIDKHDKKAYLFPNKYIGDKIFFHRDEALQKVLKEEQDKPVINTETYYEEY